MSIQAVSAVGIQHGPVWPQHTSPAALVPPAPRGFQAAPGFSKPGEIFSRLAALQLADPEKLKVTATEIAAALNAEAGKLSGVSAQALGKLANAFDRVGKTGDLASLEPPRGVQARGQTGGPAQYARSGGSPGDDPQALSQAMSIVASKLGVL